MLLALAFLVAAFVFYFDFVSSAYSDMQALKGKESGEKAVWSQESEMIQQVKELIATYQNESQTQNAVALSLPSGQDISGALTQIYGIAAVNSISLQNVNISISSVLPTNVGNSTIKTNASSSLLMNPLGSISFAIAANGSYENFKNFLSEIETNARIFDVKNLSVQPMPQSGTGGQDAFNYVLTIMAYYQTQ